MVVGFLREAWVDLGSIGVLVICLVVGICRLGKHAGKISERHREERSEWRKDANALAEKTVVALNHNTEVLSELKTLIKIAAKQ